MNFSLVSGYPVWYYLICAIAGFLVSCGLYYRSKQFDQLPRWVVPSMFTFRWIMFSTACFLLLDPLIKTLQKETQRPIIILAQDNSSSVALFDSGYYRNEYLQKISKLKETLGNEFEVRSYTFGSTVNASDSIDFSEKETGFTGLFEEITSAYSNSNLGAVIIASDGIYNRGANPVYINPGFSAPVYTIGLGDTTIRKDLILKKINHNQLVFRGNDFPVEVIIDAEKSSGEKSVLKISKAGKVVFSQEFPITKDRFNITIPAIITAEGSGTQKYTATVSELKDEISTLNNSFDFYIDVIDSRQKILIVSAAPHPDIAALREIISKNENYEVVVSNVNDVKSLVEYDLVISIQLPVQGMAGNLLSAATEQPVLYILGGATDLNKFNLFEAGLKIIPANGNPNEALPVMQSDFSLFSLSEEAVDLIKKLPPLVAPYGNYKLSSGASVFLKQRIGNVNTDYPLVVFNNREGRKTGIIAGEGIWKWRLRDYAENQSHSLSEEIFGKIVQYLSVRADKSNFRVYNEKRFNESQEVIIDAELYNESYELVNDPEVRIDMVRQDGKSYPFTFTRTQKAYRLNAGMLSPGEYKYRAVVVNKGKEHVKSGEFSVTRILVESLQSRADHQMLFSLAEKNNGQFYHHSQIDSIPEAIKANKELKTLSYSSTRTIDLISLKWLFFILMIMITAEWFLRKFYGSY